MNKWTFFYLHVIQVSSEHSLNRGVSASLKKYWKMVSVLNWDVINAVIMHSLFLLCVCEGEEREREGERLF